MRNILNLTGARASMVGGDLHDASVSVPPNVTVLIQPSGGLPLGLVGPVLEQVVARIPGITGGVARQQVTLPTGDAMRLDYQVQPAGGGAPISLQTYAIVRGSNTFLVTFSTTSDHFPDEQSTFDSMINSLQFGP